MQHAVMIEAVENHMPEVIVIDEIGTELEAQAARTIAERGVQLVGTAHGNTLENLMANPTLSDLVGGIQSVTLGDEEARRRGTQKSILERKAPPTFHVVVEIQSWDKVAIHQDVAETVDSILRGYRLPPEIRELTAEGEVRHLDERPKSTAEDGRAEATQASSAATPHRSFERHGDGRRCRRRAGAVRRQAHLPFRHLAQPPAAGDAGHRLRQHPRERLDDADVVLTDRSYYRRKPQALREAEARGMPIFVLKSNTLLQMQQALLSLEATARARPGAGRDDGGGGGDPRRDSAGPAHRAGAAAGLHPPPPARAGAALQPLVPEPRPGAAAPRPHRAGKQQRAFFSED